MLLPFARGVTSQAVCRELQSPCTVEGQQSSHTLQQLLLLNLTSMHDGLQLNSSCTKLSRAESTVYGGLCVPGMTLY